MNGTPVVCGAEPGVPTVYRSYSFDLQDRQRLYHARFIITNLQQPYTLLAPMFRYSQVRDCEVSQITRQSKAA